MFATHKKLGDKQRRLKITTYHLPDSDSLTVIVTLDEFISYVLFAMQDTDTVLFNDSNFIFKTLLVFVKILERTLSFTFQLKEKREHFIPVDFLIKHIYATLRRQRGGWNIVFF